ncbi:hypothetical protein [Alkaliphilus sp. B6464]|uniref:hypothetical protein n=1 Tax=Alkaliphilus sp. B6464 TaxID=2731219 RepID=UPI001BA78A3B|nr:hypothetical protein [Alkaliphilus sp. B6464]QUH22026.1 hypothetical protein HYG84_19160 [Alkaliphilus sp. B6464]
MSKCLLSDLNSLSPQQISINNEYNSYFTIHANDTKRIIKRLVSMYNSQLRNETKINLSQNFSSCKKKRK